LKDFVYAFDAEACPLDFFLSELLKEQIFFFFF